MKLTELGHRNDVGRYLSANGLFGFGAEIGVAYGENADVILKGSRLRTLFLVDPWKQWDAKDYVDGSSKIDFDGAFNYAMYRLSKYPGRVSVCRMTSDEASELFPEGFFDFVYLDGNHHDPQITRDLEKWYPLIKKGGLFGGHDYYDLDEPHYKCDVKSAVDAFAKKHKLALHTTMGELDQSWWIQK